MPSQGTNSQECKAGKAHFTTYWRTLTRTKISWWLEIWPLPKKSGWGAWEGPWGGCSTAKFPCPTFNRSLRLIGWQETHKTFRRWWHFERVLPALEYGPKADGLRYMMERGARLLHKALLLEFDGTRENRRPGEPLCPLHVQRVGVSNLASIVGIWWIPIFFSVGMGNEIRGVVGNGHRKPVGILAWLAE